MDETRYSACSRSPQASTRSRTAVETPGDIGRARGGRRVKTVVRTTVLHAAQAQDHWGVPSASLRYLEDDAEGALTDTSTAS